MKLTIKGIHSRARNIPVDLRGRTYLIGEITCGVTLSEDGLSIMITNHDLAKKLERVLK